MFVASPGEKIAWLRTSRRPALTQQELARLLGVSRNIIANVESGRSEPKRQMASAIKRRFGYTEDWLYDGRELPPSQVTGEMGGPAPGSFPPGISFVREAQTGYGRRMFPVVGEAGAAAFPLESPETSEEEFVEFSDDLYRPGRYAIRVRGKSMEPLIERDSYALVQPDKNPEPGMLVAVHNSEHLYLVKVLRRIGDRLELHSVNPDFAALIPGDGWELVGHVVGIRHVRGRRKYREEGDDDGIYA